MLYRKGLKHVHVLEASQDFVTLFLTHCTVDTPNDRALPSMYTNFHSEVTTAAQKKGKVFILYCKDAAPNLFSEDVLALADTLNHCGGIDCTIDHYVDTHPPNWNTWTQQKIEESEYVILVWSPSLAKMIKTPGENMMHMEKGKYYANGVVNLIHPPKFIPVYLNGYNPGTATNLEWLPPQLRTYTVYNLNISELQAALEVPEGTPQDVFIQRLQTALQHERFREVAKLVTHLRGMSDTVPPIPPQNPITVPPGVHTASHVAHPQSQLHRLTHYTQAQLQSGGHHQVYLPPPANVHPQDISREEAVPPASAYFLRGVKPENADTMQDMNSMECGSLHFVHPMEEQGCSDPDQIPEFALRQIAIRLKDKWWRLGVKLGVNSSELDHVKNALNKPTDYEDAMWKTFRLWQTSQRELATKDALKSALEDIGCGRLASEFLPDD